MRAPSPFSAFSTSVPRLTRSTIAFYSIDSGTTGVSGDWSFSGSSLISQDAVNSMQFNGVTSKTVPVTSGVPQGSILGPILFISYSAEVVAIIQHQGFRVHAFADDLEIYGS